MYKNSCVIPKSILFIGIILCILIGGVQATQFSDWTAYGDSYIRTNDTHAQVMWNVSGDHYWLSTGNASTVKALVQSAGGSGAAVSGDSKGGSGAGAGGLRILTISVTGIIKITVANSTPGATVPGNGNRGQNSSFSSIESTGGGEGVAGGGTAGQPGGSGSGGVSPSGSAGLGNLGDYTPSEGNDGGVGATGDAAAGGGGIDGIGSSNSGNNGGSGGQGYDASDFGIGNISGGAGGSGYNTGLGGTATHGGANGADGGDNPGKSATPNTGGGGSSAASSSAGTKVGGDGGSGVVVIEYQTSYAPVASFSSKNISIATNSTSQGWEGISPFTMQFNDTSTNAPTSGNYSFQGYGTNTSSAVFASTLNATAEFNAGNFTVTHGVENAYGSNISTQITWINVSSSSIKPIAISSLSRYTIQVGGYTWFNDTSLNTPDSWNWTFTDGSYAATANGTKTWWRRGIFNVSSCATNSAGTNCSYNILRAI